MLIGKEREPKEQNLEQYVQLSEIEIAVMIGGIVFLFCSEIDVCHRLIADFTASLSRNSRNTLYENREIPEIAEIAIPGHSTLTPGATHLATEVTDVIGCSQMVWTVWMVWTDPLMS